MPSRTSLSSRRIFLTGIAALAVASADAFAQTRKEPKDPPAKPAKPGTGTGKPAEKQPPKLPQSAIPGAKNPRDGGTGRGSGSGSGSGSGGSSGGSDHCPGSPTCSGTFDGGRTK